MAYLHVYCAQYVQCGFSLAEGIKLHFVIYMLYVTLTTEPHRKYIQMYNHMFASITEQIVLYSVLFRCCKFLLSQDKLLWMILSNLCPCDLVDWCILCICFGLFSIHNIMIMSEQTLYINIETTLTNHI